MPEDAHLLPATLDRDGYAAAFADSRETLDRLEVYADRLRTWQRAVNLVAPATLDAVWHRHFADSAQLLDLAPPALLRWLDLGSGAGFPGLVVAIRLAGRPGPEGRRVTLVESDQRKAAFMAEVVRATGISASISVDILVRRIEDVATRATVGTADVVSARALAPLDRLLPLVAPFLSAHSLGLLPKGRGVESEIAAASRTWRFDAGLAPSRTDAEGRIVVIRSPLLPTAR